MGEVSERSLASEIGSNSGTSSSQTRHMIIIIEPADNAGQIKIARGLHECNLADVIEQELGAGNVECRMRHAVEQLQEDGVFKRPFDHTWIMVVVQQGFAEGLKPFGSPQSYRDYLREIGVKDVPCRSTLSSAYKKYSGRWPNLTFSDTDDPKETLRRNNVGRRFLSAFNKKK